MTNNTYERTNEHALLALSFDEQWNLQVEMVWIIMRLLSQIHRLAILLIRRYAVGDPDPGGGGGGGRGFPSPGGPPPPPPLASPVDPPLVCFFNDDKIRLDVRESKIVLDSGFYVVDSDARCWTPDLCQWALDSGIPILRGILDF